MSQTWQNENCDHIQSYYALYPVPVAALLWCGVPPNQVNDHLSKSLPTNVRGVLTNPYIPCLEPKCRAMHIAIDDGDLTVCREKGVPVDDHVAPERRHIRREDLKVWIAKTFPSDKPAFLFDEIERKTHSAINADAFRALQADRDASSAEIKRLNKQQEDIIAEKDAIKSCLDRMTAAHALQNTPGERSETTYLNIIGGMLDLMLSNSPAGMPQSVFKNQAMIISNLLAHHENKQGISSRTLEDKFAAAKRSLSST